MSTTRTTAIIALISVGSGLSAAVACSTPEAEAPSSEAAVTVDPTLVVPANADLVYDVSGGIAGTREAFGIDRISFRRALSGRAITLVEERGIGSTTAVLSATAKGYVTYGRSASPRFTFDLFSMPADGSQATWLPLDGPVVSDQLAAAAGSTGALATVEVHELRAIDSLDRPEGRLYRAIFDGKRRIVENAATVNGATNADWAYRNVIVTSGVADYFVARGSSEVILLRAAEYRLLGDDVRLEPTASMDALRAVASSANTYLTLRCLRDTPPAAKSALGAWPSAGLAIDSCGN